MSPYLSSFFIITRRRIRLPRQGQFVTECYKCPSLLHNPLNHRLPVLENNNSNTNDNANTDGPNSNASIIDPNSHPDDTNGPKSPDSYKVHQKKKLRWSSADEMSIPDSVLSNYIPSHLLLLTHIIPGMNAKLNHFLMSWVH